MATDANWLRTSLCEDLAEIDRKAGRLPNVAAIEATIDHDIQQWAAMNREAKPAPPAPEGPPERDPEACLGPAQAVADRRSSKNQHTKGLRAAHGGFVPDEIQEPPCQCGGICKQCKMRARLLAIMEPLPLKERMHVGPLVWLNCRYPKFAEECIRVWQAIQRAPGLSPKRQRYMSDEDLNAWAQRKLEDICDRSNTLPGLGSWWVK